MCVRTVDGIQRVLEMRRSNLHDPLARSQNKGMTLWEYHIRRVEAQMRHALDVLRGAIEDLEKVKNECRRSMGQNK
jgi:hypothetical protein